MKKLFLLGLIAILGLISIPTTQVLAQVPRLLNFSGNLWDNTQNPSVPINSAGEPIVVEIFDQASGGVAIWSDTFQAEVVNGYFSVNLGSSEPLDLPFDMPYYVQVKIGNNGTPTERVPLTSSAYALNAQTSAFALEVADASVTQAKLAPGIQALPIGPAGGDLIGTYPNPEINPDKILESIEPGSITQDKLAPNVTTPPSGPASGDLTGSYPDPLIAPGAVRTDRIADAAVISQKIASRTILNGNIAENQIDNFVIDNSDDFTFNSVTTTGGTTVNGALVVQGMTTLNGASTINNTLNVNGSSTFDNDVQVTGNTTVNSDLTVDGMTTLNDMLTITANGADITGDVMLNNNLMVTGASTFTDAVTADNGVTITNGLTSDTGMITSATITSLEGTDVMYASGTVTDLEGTDLMYTNGEITTLNGTDVMYNSGTVTTINGTDLSYTNGTFTNLTLTNLTVTNLTATDGTFTNDLLVGNDLTVNGEMNGTLANDLTQGDGIIPFTYNNSAPATVGIADLGVTTAKINNLAVTNGKIADDAVTEPKIGAANAATNGFVLGYNGTNLEWVPGSVETDEDFLTGDGTSTNKIRLRDAKGSANEVIIKNSTNTGWTTSVINSAVIQNGTILNEDIATNASISYSKLNLANSIVTGDIVDGTIATADIGNAQVTAAKISSAGQPAGNVLVSDGANSVTWSNDPLALDYAGTYAGTNDAFSITHNGTTGKVMNLSKTDVSNNSPVLDLNGNNLLFEAIGTSSAGTYTAQVKNTTTNGRALLLEGNSVNSTGTLDPNDNDNAVLVVRNTSNGNAGYPTASASGKTAIKTYGDIWANSAIGASSLIAVSQIIVGTGSNTVTISPPANVGDPLVFSDDVSIGSSTQSADLKVYGDIWAQGSVTGASISFTSATFDNINVTNNLNVGGNTTGQAATFTTLNTSSNGMIGGTLNVTGATTLAGLTATSASVTGNSNLNGSLVVGGTTTGQAATFTSLNTSANGMIGGTLNVTGATTLAGLTASSSSVTGNSDVDGNLNVEGNFNFDSGQTVNEIVTTITGASTDSQLPTAEATWELVQSITANNGLTNNSGTMQLGGDLIKSTTITTTTTNDIYVNGTGEAAFYNGEGVYIDGTLNVGNASNGGNAASVLFDGGNVNFTNAAITQTGNTKQVSFDGNVDAKNGLDVTTANLTVGTTNINPANGNTAIGGTLNVTGSSTLSGATTVANTLSQTGGGQVTFSGNVDATNGLDVTNANLVVGTTNINPTNGNLVVGGTTNGQAATFTTLNTTSNAMVGGTLNVTGATTLAGLTASSSSVTGNSDVDGNLNVEGNFNFDSGQTVNEIVTSITSASTDNQLPTAKATWDLVQARPANNGLTNNSGTIQMGGNLNQNTTVTNNGFSLTIAGASGNNVFTSNGDVTFAEDVTLGSAAGDAITSTGAFTASNGATIQNGLTANSASVTGNSNLNGNLVVGGTTNGQAATFTTLNTTSNTEVGGTLNVTGATTINNSLSVSGSSSFSGNTINLNGGSSQTITHTGVGAGVKLEISSANGNVQVENTTFNGNDVTIPGAATIQNGGTVSGAVLNVQAGLTANAATLTTADINGGTIDGTTINGSTIGGTTAAAATFTDVNMTGNFNFDSGQKVDEIVTSITSSSSHTQLPTAKATWDLVNNIPVQNGLTNNSGTIEMGGNLTKATTIGMNSNSLTFDGSTGDVIITSTGALTAGNGATVSGATLAANAGLTANAATLTTADINGGTLDGATIGNTSAQAASFTTINATGASSLQAITATSGSFGTTLEVDGSSTFDGAVNINNTITQSGNNQVTFTGNVDATNGLDVTTANLTVGGTRFVVNQATGNIDTDGNLSVDGNTTLGDNSADNVVVNASLDARNSISNQGSSNSGRVHIGDNLQVDNDYFSTNGNLELTNGNMTVGGNYTTTNGNFTSTNGAITLTNGNLSVGGISTHSGKLNANDEIRNNSPSGTLTLLDNDGINLQSTSGVKVTGNLNTTGNTTVNGNFGFDAGANVDEILTSVRATGTASDTKIVTEKAVRDAIIAIPTSNGITNNSGTIELGGNLTKATTVGMNSNSFTFDGSTGDVIIASTGALTAGNGATVNNAALTVNAGLTANAATLTTAVINGGSATLSTADIDGGTIDGTMIGNTSASSATFSSAVINGGSATLSTADINGGTLDGVSIGNTSASSASFVNVNISSSMNFDSGQSVDEIVTAVSSTSTNTQLPTAKSVWDAALYNANNGITLNSKTFTLGGDLSSNTTITNNGNSLSIGGGSATTTFASNGNVTVGGSSTFTGAATLGNMTSSAATLTTADIDGGTIDNVTIGNTTAATGTFSTVDINGGTIDGVSIGNTSAATGTFSTVDINGGTLDNTTIGNTTAASATFSAAVINGGSATLSTADIDGGTIDGTMIGNNTASSATFTTINGNSVPTGSGTFLTTANAGATNGISFSSASFQLGGNLTGNTTITNNGNSLSIGGGSATTTFASNGNITVGGASTFTGAITLGNVSGSNATFTNLNNTTIGNTSAAAASFTTINASNNLTGAAASFSSLNLTGNLTGSAATFSTLTTTGAASFGSTATFTGAANFNGAVTLGDASGDAISSVGQFTASNGVIVTGPASTNYLRASNIGSSTVGLLMETESVNNSHQEAFIKLSDANNQYNTNTGYAINASGIKRAFGLYVTTASPNDGPSVPFPSNRFEGTLSNSSDIMMRLRGVSSPNGTALNIASTGTPSASFTAIKADAGRLVWSQKSDYAAGAVTIDGAYTMHICDEAQAGAVTINLPSSSAVNGQILYISYSNTDGGAGTGNLTPGAGYTISGTGTPGTLVAAGETAALVFVRLTATTGTWYRIN